jgi:hypothetical protein
MPVSFNVIGHPARGFSEPRVATVEKLFEAACPRQYRRSLNIIQSSFDKSQFRESHISASENGFVWAAYHAYSRHHHLCIRPEDVWFAILTQISFFINAHAEDLRHFFVEHQGQKPLCVFIDDFSPDFREMATQMAGIIAKNVKDPGMRDWVMPDFSTTTPDDSIVGAILFMGAMQKYFAYEAVTDCGLPSVTLLGERADWAKIYKRLDKLELLGVEPALFAKLLRPVLRRMIMSFDAPGSPEVIHFWNTLIHRTALSSGTDYLTGWLTAFCFWDEKGVAKRQEQKVLMDDVAYLFVEVDQVPAGFASVPVSVIGGNHSSEATMVAGSVGILATPSQTLHSPDTSTDDLTKPDAMQSATPSSCKIEALSGWWMYKNETLATIAAREAQKTWIGRFGNSTVSWVIGTILSNCWDGVRK